MPWIIVPNRRLPAPTGISTGVSIAVTTISVELRHHIECLTNRSRIIYIGHRDVEAEVAG